MMREFGRKMTSPSRTRVVCALLLIASADCSRWSHGSLRESSCSLPPADDEHEPLYAFGRSLLADSVWASLRESEGLHGAADTVRWVEDSRACRGFAEALASGSGRPVDYSMPIAAVHVGAFYLVRYGNSASHWLVGPDLRLRFASVVPN